MQLFVLLSRLPTIFILFLGLSTSLQAAGGGVSASPYKLNEFLGLPITNSILTTWVISILFIVVIRFAVGSPKLIPSKGQAVVEGMIEGLRNLLQPIIGKKAFPITFPLLIGLFIYIMLHNWSGLLPGVGSFGHYDEHGHFKYWMRPANADLNSTLGMSIVAMIVDLKGVSWRIVNGF